MPQYSLSEYMSKIAALIQDGQIEEAIAHTRHVLSLYPRYLPAYSLLARASMEKGDLSRASHFFQSVISANPEDADAWMNQAHLSDDLGEVEQAAWYMERAFEIEPGSGHIREKLRQLYSQRDGVERNRIKLTPAALARTQAKSGSFRRASQKLQRLLRTSESMSPLQIATLEVTLARALWNQEGQAALADEVCGSLLNKLPECLQANLIRASIYTNTGRAQDAEPYINTALELDPEGEFAFRMLGPQSPLPQTRVEIPYLDYQPAPAEPQRPARQEPEDTSWLEQVGQDTQPLAQLEQNAADAVPEDSEQEAEQANAPLSPITEPELEATVVEQPSPEPPAEPEVPAWLREIQQESTQNIEEEQDLDWLQESEEEPAGQTELETEPQRAPQEKVPEWLEGLQPMQDEPEPQPETLDSEQQTMVTDIPDWLLDLSQEAEPGTVEQVLEDSGQEAESVPVKPASEDVGAITQPLPRLRDLGLGKAFELESAQPSELDLEPAQQAGELDWREQPEPTADLGTAEPVATTSYGPPEGEPSEALSERESADVEPAVADLGLSEDLERPAWLQELFAEIQGPSAAAVTPPPIAEAEPVIEEPPIETVPSIEQEPPEDYEWLTDLGIPDALSQEGEKEGKELPVQAEELEPALEPTPEAELPDWLLEMRDQTDTETEAAAILSGIETEAEEEEEELDQELPSWMQELQPTAELEAETRADGGLETEEAPDWLAELDQEPLSAMTVDQMPDLLGELRSAEPETAVEPGLTEPEPAFEPEQESMGDLEWLQELEAAQIQEAQPVDEAAPEPVVPEVPSPAAVPEFESEAVFAETPPAPLVDASLDREPAPLDLSTPDTSAQQYEALVALGPVDEALIAELQEAVNAHPKHSGLQRVLGDAYMRSNQLEQALNAYREALRKL